ncbi:hypothetical protein B0E46_05520 [Rhodanobacter sp. B04]|nr:hypothetical protein B0E46_05520 [Rhodanobacter sp. B04]
MKLQIPPMTPWKDVLVHLAIWAILLSAPSIVYSFFPKPDFDAALRSKYPHQIALVMGGGDSSSGNTTYARRSYLLVPSAPQLPEVVQITQVDSERPKVVVQNNLFLISLVIFIGLSVYYFRKRWRTQQSDA